jgi:integrase
MLERLVYPVLGDRRIGTIRRSEIVDLLDNIEDERGPVMADRTLATLRRLMTWQAGRSDDYNSPIVRGMARTKPKERARQRILNDDELRAVWRAAESSKNMFGYFVRFLLLTAVRRNEAAHMRRVELSGDDWIIAGARHKSKKEFLVPLSEAARELLGSIPIIASNKDGFVFTSDGKRPLGGFSKAKRTFDKACGVTGWRLHDLRRSARSLMSRAGVPTDHAERAVGHVIGGVRAVYDVHEYHREKLAALEALASQIKIILDPKKNVVRLRAR